MLISPHFKRMKSLTNMRLSNGWHTLGEFDTCKVFWLKSWAGFSGEIEHKIAIFKLWKTPKRASPLRKAMYRGAIGHVSHCDRACFEARKGIFRHRKRHVSQQEIRNREPETGHSNDNRLNVRRIHKHNENRVFSPHRLLIEKKCVVFTIVCCLFSTILRKLLRCLCCSQTAKRAMALAFYPMVHKKKAQERFGITKSFLHLYQAIGKST